MNSNLKIALALGVLVAAVVGVTIITQYTEGETERKKSGSAGIVGLPLAFKYSDMYYFPEADSVALREFPGYFEVDATVHWATFLLRNPHPVPVKVTAAGRSCSACTTARLAVLSPAENKAMRRAAAVGAAVGGMAPDAEIGLYRRAMTGTLGWKELEFEQADKALTVDPAVDPDTPTWCVLQIGFEVKAVGPKKLYADIGLSAEGMKAPATQRFNILFVGDSAERVAPANHDFGVFREKEPPKSVELYYWSTTRPQDDLAPPKVGGLDGDPFVATTAPVPLTPAELTAVAARASGGNIPLRARSGYKFTVTLRRDNPSGTGPRELDIGPVERRLTVGGSDGTTGGAAVTLTASVAGLVTLAGGDAVNFGDFRGRDGKTVKFHLTSDRLKLELEPQNYDPDELAKLTADPKTADAVKAEYARSHTPPGVTVTADGPPAVANEVKRWAYSVTAGGKDHLLLGPLDGKLIVFRVKGTSQLIRLPLKGVANGN